jgi:protein TonB
MTCFRCHIAGVLSSILVHGVALFWFVNSQSNDVQQTRDEPLALTLVMFQSESVDPLVSVPEQIPNPRAIPEPLPVPIPEPVLEPVPEPEPKPIPKKPEPMPIPKPEPIPVLQPVPEPPQKPQKTPVSKNPAVGVTAAAFIAPEEAQKNDLRERVARAEKEYLNSIVKKIEQNKFYPGRVKRMGKEGDVTVEFILNRDGSIQDLKVVEVKGSAALKKAALKAIKVSALFPPFPVLSDRQSWSFKTCLQYRLQ